MRPRLASLRGLGLIEALVATTIAAVLIGGLLSVLGSSTAATARIEAQRAALSLARRLISDPAPEEGSGFAGALAWTLRIERSPYDFDRSAQDGYRLQRITVSVTGPGLGSDLRVATERLLR